MSQDITALLQLSMINSMLVQVELTQPLICLQQPLNVFNVLQATTVLQALTSLIFAQEVTIV